MAESNLHLKIFVLAFIILIGILLHLSFLPAIVVATLMAFDTGVNIKNILNAFILDFFMILRNYKSYTYACLPVISNPWLCLKFISMLIYSILD